MGNYFALIKPDQFNLLIRFAKCFLNYIFAIMDSRYAQSLYNVQASYSVKAKALYPLRFDIVACYTVFAITPLNSGKVQC